MVCSLAGRLLLPKPARVVPAMAAMARFRAGGETAGQHFPRTITT